MRIVLLGVIAALAAGCGDRRTFDESYSDSQNEIERRADAIDRELANETENSGEAGNRAGS